MSLRGIATAASTMVVAIALALIVPTAQLRTEADRVACCCPDPAKCKCPDHNPDESGQSSMRACHKKAPELTKTQLSAFVAPKLAVIDAPACPVVAVLVIVDDPHPAPPPRRPDAPS